MDCTAEEARTTGCLDALVERGLTVEKDRGIDSGTIGDVRLEGDVRSENRARAGRAEFVTREARAKEEERGVRLLEGVEVGGHDLLGLGVQRGSGGCAAGNLGRAVVARVIFGARRSTEGNECVKDVVDLEDVLVQARGELGLARAVEVRESTTNGSIGAGSVAAKTGERTLDGRRGCAAAAAWTKGSGGGSERVCARLERGIRVKLGEVS